MTNQSSEISERILISLESNCNNTKEMQGYRIEETEFQVLLGYGALESHRGL
jgi:hypothetical protein